MKSSDKLLRAIGSKRGAMIIVILLLAGVLLIYFGTAEPAVVDGAAAESEEERLADFCSSVDGVGDCLVHITYSTSSDRYGKETKESILGIAVLCDGADRSEVKSKLTELLASLYGIGSNRVRVERLKK